MKLPKIVKVGYHVYEVREVEDLEKIAPKNLEVSGIWGFVDFEKAIIWIKKDIEDRWKKTTFIHELLHTILEEAGMPQDSKAEKLILSIQNVFAQVFEDNDFSFLRDKTGE